MSTIATNRLLPVEIVFHPNWWNKNIGISFDKSFFFDAKSRVDTDLEMRRYLQKKFPDLELVENANEYRPVVGGVLLAAGYIISAILGCDINYSEDSSPEVITKNLTDDQIMSLKILNIHDTEPMDDLVKMMDALETQFGYLEGDINWEGVQNVALNLRGQELFTDYFTKPELVDKLLTVVAQTIMQFVTYMKKRIGTTSISVNRIVRKVNPKINLHSNCSVTMISPQVYTDFLLKFDQQFAHHFQPYGIHYCGNNMDKMSLPFSKLDGVEFFDVGWGSDIQVCRSFLPEKFFSLRLDPGRLLRESADIIEQDILKLLNVAGPLHLNGLCCINMDFQTPEENIRKIFEIAQHIRSKQKPDGTSL